MIRTNIYLPRKLKEITQKVADRKHMSYSEIIRAALREYIKREVEKLKKPTK